MTKTILEASLSVFLVVINVKSSIDTYSASIDAQINTTNSLKNSIDNLSSEYLSLLAEQSKNQQALLENFNTLNTLHFKEEVMKTKEVKDLWLKFNEYSNKLTTALGRTSNIVGEYAEHLAHEFYGGELLGVSSASADIKNSDDILYQVKSRKIKNTESTQLGVIRSWEFDFLVVILFDANGAVKQALEVPVAVAKEYGTKNNHQNGWVITTTQKFLNDKRSKNITAPLSALNK